MSKVQISVIASVTIIAISASLIILFYVKPEWLRPALLLSSGLIGITVRWSRESTDDMEKEKRSGDNH